MNNEYFFIQPHNLTTVLSAFFKEFGGTPLAYVPMDEAVSLFNECFPLNEDGEYELLESDIKGFLEKINGIHVDRLMVDMDKKGLATLAHDGNELCLIANK